MREDIWQDIMTDRAKSVLQANIELTPIQSVYVHAHFRKTILCGRILYFTSHELVWECNSWFSCGRQHGNVEIIEGDDLSSRIIRKPNLEKERRTQQLYTKWTDILTLLTERGPSDDFSSSERLLLVLLKTDMFIGVALMKEEAYVVE
jgi:hypothetical protein